MSKNLAVRSYVVDHGGGGGSRRERPLGALGPAEREEAVGRLVGQLLKAAGYERAFPGGPGGKEGMDGGLRVAAVAGGACAAGGDDAQAR